MGKKVNFRNPGPPLTRDEIDAFEQEIGGRLPDDYKEFMLAHNGGLAEPPLGLLWEGKMEHVSFSQLSPTDVHGMRASLRRLRELNPIATEGFLPIAGTWSEREICMAFRGKVGAVYFTVYKYKTVYRGDLVPSDVTMVPLADSFSEFLDTLEELPDPYCRIVELGEKGTPDDLAQFLGEGNSIETVGRDKATLVCEAVKHENLPMIKACIARGARLSGTLHVAAAYANTELIQMLVDAGADVNERNEFGSTPLYHVPGTALPGEEGARNRATRKLLIKLGAVK